jgi:hypothetical protein
LNRLCIHRDISQLPGLGFPIRTSPDQRLLASPRGLSQLATSFFAFLRQGIHTHALSSLTIKLTLRFEFFLTSPGYTGPVLGRLPNPAFSARLRYSSNSDPKTDWKSILEPIFSRTCYLQPCSCPSITIQFSKTLFCFSADPRCQAHTKQQEAMPDRVGDWFLVFEFSAGGTLTCVPQTHFMVGLSGLEPLTSPLSWVRSSQLSYRPIES